MFGKMFGKRLNDVVIYVKLTLNIFESMEFYEIIMKNYSSE